jgi:hypothetical protein
MKIYEVRKLNNANNMVSGTMKPIKAEGVEVDSHGNLVFLNKEREYVAIFAMGEWDSVQEIL